MAKVILKDGTEEYLSPGAAQKKVASGEARFPIDVHNGMGAGTTYKTRQLVAETPQKVKRKRRSKAEIEADNAREANED